MFRREQKDNVSVPTAFALLLGVGLLVWFFSLPGEMLEKWDLLTKYVSEKQDVIGAAIGVIGSNSIMMVIGLVALTGFGRLGQKIKGYYLSQKKFEFDVVYPVVWATVSSLVYLSLSDMDVLSPLLPFPEVIPNWQVDLFLTSVLVSASSLLGFTAVFLLALFSGIRKRAHSKTLPKIKDTENKLIVGSINE